MRQRRQYIASRAALFTDHGSQTEAYGVVKSVISRDGMNSDESTFLVKLKNASPDHWLRERVHTWRVLHILMKHHGQTGEIISHEPPAPDALEQSMLFASVEASAPSTSPADQTGTTELRVARVQLEGSAALELDYAIPDALLGKLADRLARAGAAATAARAGGGDRAAGEQPAWKPPARVAASHRLASHVHRRAAEAGELDRGILRGAAAQRAARHAAAGRAGQAGELHHRQPSHTGQGMDEGADRQDARQRTDAGACAGDAEGPRRRGHVEPSATGRAARHFGDQAAARQWLDHAQRRARGARSVSRRGVPAHASRSTLSEEQKRGLRRRAGGAERWRKGAAHSAARRDGQREDGGVFAGDRPGAGARQDRARAGARDQPHAADDRALQGAFLRAQRAHRRAAQSPQRWRAARRVVQDSRGPRGHRHRRAQRDLRAAGEPRHHHRR